jgi:hypothetical protein
VLRERRSPLADDRSGPVGAWLAAGYALPARLTDNKIEVDLRTVTVRLGLLWEPRRLGRWAIRLGLGGGIDWVAFNPLANAAGVRPAAAGSFATPMASALAAMIFRPSDRWTLDISAVAEVATKQEHYDLRNADGSSTRAFTPDQLRPGLSLGASWRL